MRPLQHPLTPGRFADWPLAAKSIAGLWAVYSLTVIARAMLGTDPGAAVQNKLITVVAGVLLTALIYLAVSWFGRGREIRQRAIIAGVASLIAACAMSATLIGVEDLMRESKEEFRYPTKEGIVISGQG